MLRNLTFAVQFACFIIRPKKEIVFFEQLLSQKATVEQLLEKSRGAFWKISSNLWKALGVGQGFMAVWGGGGVFPVPVPLPKPSPASRFDVYPHARLGTFETKMRDPMRGPFQG